eukprot:TRINITY_DN2008_c0_g1_i2.p1 TRINITY_DN2008_c0_g1~~TRINITY_DN2008_c0_g1_i2.p1  ORF type:complete len:1001 (+),score=260.72 TRINITY_DN2008_c0_g1_i2:451-3453(+)
MMLLMDERIDGMVRERMLVAYLRYKGHTHALSNIDEVCKLFRTTGFNPAVPKKPSNYPEEYLTRYPIPREAIKMIIGRLRSEDIYHQAQAYPLPEHRSTALATQASMLYVILYFSPDILHREQATMREIVDKHFADNWIISWYLGFTVDLSVAWAGYKSAQLALNNTLALENVKDLHDKQLLRMAAVRKDLEQLLTEGVLVEEYVLDHVNRLLNVLREANVTLRWVLLHTTVKNIKIRQVVLPGLDAESILLLLLNTSQFEFILKNMFRRLLETKLTRWQEFKQQATEHVKELGEYFSGEKLLSKVQKDENLEAWFKDMSGKIDALDYNDSTLAGRKIQQITTAFIEVEEFHQIETNLQVKQFLHDTRGFLHQMIRTINIKEETLAVISLVSDMSYAKIVIEDYVSLMQTRIKKDPFAVTKLRSAFLKLASLLDLPLVRINQANSPDLVSVSEFYSSELVGFVRSVLEIIPRSMFYTLNEVINYQTTSLTPVPTRFEREKIREVAQLEERHGLAKATHAISVFAEGIRSMETTLVGVIEVQPQQLLEDGIRKELVHRLSETLHKTLQFQKRGTGMEIEQSLDVLARQLDGFAQSFEYIQDYINIFGLKIWQEEFARIINYNVEQECNRFLKLKVYDMVSHFQSETNPIPKYPPTDEISVNFLGRVSRELFALTSPSRTVYVDQMSGWFDGSTGREVAGIRTFSALHNSLSVWGLAGIDRFTCFVIAERLQSFVKAYRREFIPSLKGFLPQMEEALEPTTCLPTNSKQLYDNAVSKVKNTHKYILDTVLRLGHMQLIRKHAANELNFSCKLDSANLGSALDVMNRALIKDIQAHYRWPETHPYPDDKNPLLGNLSELLEMSGIHNPLQKIYVTTEPLPHLPLLVFLFVIAHLPRLQYRKEFATLVARKKDDVMDGAPFAVGVGSLLHQFHSAQLLTFLAYMGQYCRTIVNATPRTGKAGEDIPVDVVGVLVFLEDLCKFGFTNRKTIEAYVPAYLFDRFKH